MPHAIDCPEPDCPELERWHDLFADAFKPELREMFERHLESCSACQERLDRAAECDDSMRAMIRRVGNTAEASLESTHVSLVDRLLGASSPRSTPVAPADLYFLAPSDRPGILGTLGVYEVEEVIGQGGMGVILKAYEPALQRVVAVKVMAPAVAGSAVARQRFTREAKAAAAVSHDHLVTIHGVFETEGLPYLVMQYVTGGSLQDRLDRSERLEVQEIVRIGMETARGLAAAHAQGLTHRDIKPANLLLEESSGRVRITDFGLARMADDTQLTQNGVVTGTPEYMAPEQARGEAVDPRADLFSLGSVLYAMCTGAPPFRGSSPLAVLNHVTQQAPKPIRALNPHIPAWLEAIISRLMAKDPAERYPSAAEVAALLEGCLAHVRQPQLVPAPELPAPPRRTGKRFRRRHWLAAALLLAGVGFAVWFAGAAGESSSEQKPLRERCLTFKGMTEISAELEYFGPDAEECVHFEPEGLRITTPTGFPSDHPSLGVAYSTRVKGDFEITTTFEILHEPEPEEVGDKLTRFTLDVVFDNAEDLAALSRMVDVPQQQGSTQFLAFSNLWDQTSKSNRQRVKGFPTKAKTGRLRIARTGSVLSYEVAEGASDEFRRLQLAPFSAADVREVRIVATSCGPKAWLDVRTTELRIRADSQPEPPVPPSKGEKKHEFLLLAVALMILLPLGVVLIAWRRRRGSRPAKEEPKADSPQNAPADGAAASAIPVTCSGCGKTLKVKSTLAGKKVKCPKCGEACMVPVPEQTGGT